MVYDKGGISDSIKGQGHWSETDETPTLTLFLNDLSDRSLRRVKQLGVTGVSIANLDTGGLETWTDEVLKRHIDRVAEADLELRNVMFDPGELFSVKTVETKTLKRSSNLFRLQVDRDCR